MWEIWTKLDLYDLYAPLAWFATEETAHEYASYLEAAGDRCAVHYNETAVMEHWNAPDEWLGSDFADLMSKDAMRCHVPMSDNCQ